MADSVYSELSLALSQLIGRVGDGLPINLAVSVCDAQEVTDLKQQVSDLTAELARREEQLNRTEYLYRCEVLVNAELCDLCKRHGVKVRPSMFNRPSR